MKKLFFVAILGTLVACGESSTSTTVDSTATTVDTATVVAPDTTLAPAAADTAKVDSAAVDTTKH